MTTTTNRKRIPLLTALLLVPLGFRVPNVGAEVNVPENFVLVKAGTTTANNGGITLPYDTRNNFLATTEAYRGYRGGSWYQSDKACRIGFAACNEPRSKVGGIGFRVARTLMVKPTPAKKQYARREVGDCKNTVVALALATQSETLERAEIAKEALSLLNPQGTIDLTKECSLFAFINDPGPAGYKGGRMSADKHLVN